MTTVDGLNASPKWRAFSLAVLGFFVGISIWSYGYYWGGRLFVLLLGYDPIFETPSMQFVSCVAAGIVSSVASGLILWNRRLLPLLAAILAIVILISKYNLHSTHWTGVDFVAILLGFAVVPLIAAFLEFRAGKNTAGAE